jgi:hypothetical protein
MSLITLVLVLAVVGLLVWLLTTYVPMPQPVKTVIIALVVIVLVIWLMRALGVPDVRI